MNYNIAGVFSFFHNVSTFHSSQSLRLFLDRYKIISYKFPLFFKEDVDEYNIYIYIYKIMSV